jgi:tetratricopeptide (TPR) repeat protein
MAKSKSKRKSEKKKSTPHRFKFLSLKDYSLTLVVFVAISAALYFSGAGYDFILDDKVVISENDFTKKGLSGIADHLRSDNFQGYFGEKKDLLIGGRYRPMSLIFFSVIYEFFGLNTAPYHWVNIILYALTAFLIFYILSILLPQKKYGLHWWESVAFWGATLFLFHPIHTEAVANIKGLDEILTLFFALLSWTWAAKVYNKPQSIIHPIILGTLFFLALMSKENALTFLAVIPLSFYCFGKLKRMHLLPLMSPMIVSAALYLVIRTSVLGYVLSPGKEVTDILNNPFYGLSGVETFSTVMLTWLKYLGLLIFPHPLVHDYYPYAIPIMDLSDWQVWVSIMLHVALLVLGLFWAFRKKLSGFAILYYFITFSIVSNLFFTVGTFMNERFQFMPSLSYTLLISWFLMSYLPGKLNNRLAAPLKWTILAVLLIGYSYKTVDRLPDWSSHLTLNQSAVEEYPTSARSTLFMGTALYNEALEMSNSDEKKSTLEQGLEWVNQSISVFPTYGNRNTRDFRYFNAYKMKVGIASEIYKIDGNLDALLIEMKEVATYKPEISYIMEFLDYLHRRGEDRSKMESFYHELAHDNLLRKRNQPSIAAAFVDKGLEYLPNSALLWYDKYLIYQQVGRTQEAQQFLQRATGIDPNISQKVKG